jgi:NAD(P)H-hydrate epimerase
MNDKPIPQFVEDLPPLPARPESGHKGTFGHVLIVSGSRGMSGAAVLSGLGALRSGAGLVSLAVPAGIQSVVSAAEPSYLTIGLPEDSQGRISGAACGDLLGRVKKHSAWAIGPGWGQSEELCSLARELYETVEIPVVVDADALNALATGSGDLPPAPAPRVLTPHPGEFARLIKSTPAAVQKNRTPWAVDYAKTHGIVLLLKGRGTVITDGERVAINQTGNNGMATGGAGDVLTGVIAALLASGMPAFEAAQLAAHLHGLAGDIAAAELTEPGLIASDLPCFLPKAWQKLGDEC